MFAMLTGTLPFMVEPFNIKQLHQKMVNGEISAIPNDVSKGDPTLHKYKDTNVHNPQTHTHMCVCVSVGCKDTKEGSDCAETKRFSMRCNGI